jgi:hypothetical protein
MHCKFLDNVTQDPTSQLFQLFSGTRWCLVNFGGCWSLLVIFLFICKTYLVIHNLSVAILLVLDVEVTPRRVFMLKTHSVERSFTTRG